MSSSSSTPSDIHPEVKARGNNVHWYRADIESVNEPARRLLEGHNGIPADKVLSHVLKLVSLLYS